MTQPTQAQIEAVRRVVERCRKANPFHMSVPVSGATAMEWLLEELTAEPSVGIHIINKAIERCARWLTEEAKALRSQVSGGDGSEHQWIEAKALDRAAAAIRARLKEKP